METPVPAATPPIGEPEATPLPWFEWLETAFRRRRWVVVGLLIGLAAAALLVAITPPYYRATSRILLSETSISGTVGQPLTSARVQTEIAMLRSPALLRSVLTGVLVPQDPEDVSGTVEEPDGIEQFIQEHLPGLHARFRGAGDPAAARVENLARRIEVVHVQRSNVLEIAYTSADPRFCAWFVNGLIDHHIDRIESSQEETRARTFFEKQAELLEQRWREARDKLDEYRGALEAEFPGGSEEQIRIVLAGLQSERIAATADVMGLQARLDVLEGRPGPEGEPESRTRYLADEPFSLLEIRLRDLRLRRSELAAKYTEASPEMAEIDAQIAEVERLIETEEPSVQATDGGDSRQTLATDVLQTRAGLAAARERESALAAQIVSHRDQIRALQIAATELERLENEAELAEEAYQSYLRRAEEARITGAMDESGIVNVTVLERADVPTTPLPTQGGRKLLVGLIVGLFLGVGAAFARDYLDPSVKSAAHAARLAGSRVLAEIPSD